MKSCIPCTVLSHFASCRAILAKLSVSLTVISTMNVYDCTIERYGVILWYGVIPIVCHKLQAVLKDTKQILCILKHNSRWSERRTRSLSSSLHFIVSITVNVSLQTKLENILVMVQYWETILKQGQLLYVLLNVIELK